MSPASALHAALPAILSVALLGGIWIEGRMTHVPASDVDAYHRSCAAAADQLPFMFETDTPAGRERWEGTERKEAMPPASVKLLRPNVLRAIRYDNRATGEYATLVIVQCKDARDMGGHYPPHCYPAHGWKMQFDEQRAFPVRGMDIKATEYRFTWETADEYDEKLIYGFFVRPDGSIESGHTGVLEAAANRRAKMFGAAQIQVVFDPSMSRERRDRVFQAIVNDVLLAEPRPFIDAVRDGGR